MIVTVENTFPRRVIVSIVSYPSRVDQSIEKRHDWNTLLLPSAKSLDVNQKTIFDVNTKIYYITIADSDQFYCRSVRSKFKNIRILPNGDFESTNKVEEEVKLDSPEPSNTKITDYFEPVLPNSKIYSDRVPRYSMKTPRLCSDTCDKCEDYCDKNYGNHTEHLCLNHNIDGDNEPIGSGLSNEIHNGCGVCGDKCVLLSSHRYHLCENHSDLYDAQNDVPKKNSKCHRKCTELINRNELLPCLDDCSCTASLHGYHHCSKHMDNCGCCITGSQNSENETVLPEKPFDETREEKEIESESVVQVEKEVIVEQTNSAEHTSHTQEVDSQKCRGECEYIYMVSGVTCRQPCSCPHLHLKHHCKYHTTIIDYERDCRSCKYFKAENQNIPDEKIKEETIKENPIDEVKNEPVTETKIEHIECPACTYHNQLYAIECEMCYSELKTEPY